VTRLRLAFFGTPEFAVPTLQMLLDGPHELVAVVSQPDRRRGRGRQTSPSPVSQTALDSGVALLRPENASDAGFADALAAHEIDLGVVVAFGQFIPKRIRQMPTRGYMINGHASLLPRFRGAAPIVHSILAGDRETGVSAMRVEREMDAGAVALQRRLAIGDDETAGELSARMAALTAATLAEAIESIAAERVEWTEQDASLASEAPKIGPADAQLDWSEAASALVLRVRAMAPAPGAWSELEGEKLRILAAEALAEPVDRPPGTLRTVEGEPARVATGDGWLLPRVLQRPGKRALDIDAFTRGRPLPDGARFDTSSDDTG
jgi:methionyl-tRNA formyltransferase